MDDLPCFIDIESSGLGDESYPLSIAWSNEVGEIQRLLLNVGKVPAWTYWDPAAEAIHGLERERLLRNGWDPAYVVSRLLEDCGDRPLWSDAPVFDQMWLDRLFEVVGVEQRYELGHLDDLLLEHMLRSDEMVYECVLRMDALKAQVRKGMSGRHDAGYDVGSFIQLWLLANGQPAKMNHGIGALPQRSETGTFMPIKLRGS